MRYATQEYTINSQMPVNLRHRLSVGLVSRWKVIPAFRGGSRFIDLCKRNNGTLTNMVQSDWKGTNRPGGYGALDFVTNNYVSVPHDASLNITGALTIAAWIYLRATVNYGAIVMRGDTGGTRYGYEYQFNASTDKIALYMMGANASWTTDADTAVTHNVWTHLIGSYDGVNDLTFYHNGVLDGQHTVAGGAITGNSDPLSIGRRNSDGLYINALIDDVCIYNRHFSSNDAALLHQLSQRQHSSLLDWSPGLWVNSAAAAAGTILPQMLQHHHFAGRQFA